MDHPVRAQRPYEQAVGQRKVVGYRNLDGSAKLTGYNLSVDRVGAPLGRLVMIGCRCPAPRPSAGRAA
jgi:hypothetical protein